MYVVLAEKRSPRMSAFAAPAEGIAIRTAETKPKKQTDAVLSCETADFGAKQ